MNNIHWIFAALFLTTVIPRILILGTCSLWIPAKWLWTWMTALSPLLCRSSPIRRFTSRNSPSWNVRWLSPDWVTEVKSSPTFQSKSQLRLNLPSKKFWNFVEKSWIPQLLPFYFLRLHFHSFNDNIKLYDDGRLNVVRKLKLLTVPWFIFLFRYSISPVSDINFGALLVNNKKQKQFTIYNHGKYEFKYTITLMQKDKDNQQGQGRGNRP